MAVPDRSIDPKLLAGAQAEFLEFGFEKASLKRICERADVTTGALYNRYRGKDGLFAAVVEDTVDAMNAVVNEKSTADMATLSNQELLAYWRMDEAYMLWWFGFLHRRREGFTLLLKGAAGSSYANFEHDWVNVMCSATWRSYVELQKRGLARRDVTQQEMHVLLSSFWAAIYEPFVHGFTWEEIQLHSAVVCGFFDWGKALGLVKQ